MVTKTAAVIKLDDIKNNPQEHWHTFDELTACSMIDGHLSLEIFDAHERFAPVRVNRPAGNNCDVTLGRCACGNTH